MLLAAEISLCPTAATVSQITWHRALYRLGGVWGGVLALLPAEFGKSFGQTSGCAAAGHQIVVGLPGDNLGHPIVKSLQESRRVCSTTSCNTRKPRAARATWLEWRKQFRLARFDVTDRGLHLIPLQLARLTLYIPFHGLFYRWIGDTSARGLRKCSFWLTGLMTVRRGDRVNPGPGMRAHV